MQKEFCRNLSYWCTNLQSSQIVAINPTLWSHHDPDSYMPEKPCINMEITFYQVFPLLPNINGRGDTSSVLRNQQGEKIDVYGNRPKNALLLPLYLQTRSIVLLVCVYIILGKNLVASCMLLGLQLGVFYEHPASHIPGQH